MWIVYLAVLGLSVGAVCPEIYVCTGSQWEGIQDTTLGEFTTSGLSVTQTRTNISYDLNNTRLATTAQGTKDGQPIEYKDIYDYKQRILYNIEGHTCHKFKLNSTFKKWCVPENASWSMDVTWYGWAENREFIWEFKGQNQGLQYYITVLAFTPPNLMMEKVYGEYDGAYIYKNSIFANISRGISDTTVFTPPSSCNNVGYSGQVSWIRATPGFVSY